MEIEIKVVSPDCDMWYKDFVGQAFQVERFVTTWAYRNVIGFVIKGPTLGFGIGTFVKLEDCYVLAGNSKVELIASVVG